MAELLLHAKPLPDPVPAALAEAIVGLASAGAIEVYRNAAGDLALNVDGAVGLIEAVAVTEALREHGVPYLLSADGERADWKPDGDE